MNLLVVARICFYKCSLYEVKAFDMMDNGTNIESVDSGIIHITLNLFHATVLNFIMSV